MRGADTFTESLFSVPKLDNSFRPRIGCARSASWRTKSWRRWIGCLPGMYEADIKGGRPSIAPEKLLRAMPLQLLYSIRSERQLMEQTQYNLMLRWFIGLSGFGAIPTRRSVTLNNLTITSR
jgi:hypothetical protein